MKIVLIGGGSFVFAPTVLEDVIVKNRMADTELVLVDPNVDAVEAMAGTGRRIADELNVSVNIHAVYDRKQALLGADYVIVSAAPQGARRWQMDYDILAELGIADQARECGGVGGLMNAFRSITLLMDICRDMEEWCPKAMLLDVTNPMPRVITAIERYSSIRSVGFCNIAYRGPDGYDFLPKLIGKDPDDVEIVTAGLNHFAWLMSMKDKQTGEDLMPVITQYIAEDHESTENELSAQSAQATKSTLNEGTRRELRVMRRWLQEYGGIVAGSVDHHGEYLPYQEDVLYPTVPPYHGTEEERRMRLQELQETAAGNRDWKDQFSNQSWEHPVDIALALGQQSTTDVDILNVRNNGALAQLPEDRIVEVPVSISNGQITPITLPQLPAKLAEICRKVSDVHELVAEAAVRGDIELARQALAIDPAVVDKEAAYIALERMLQAHADLLPQFHK